MYGGCDSGRTYGGKRSCRYDCNDDDDEESGKPPVAYGQNEWNRSVVQNNHAHLVQLYMPLGHINEREMKYFDTSISVTTLTEDLQTILVANMFAMAQGAGPNQRLGNRIIVKSIDIRGHMGVNDAGSSGGGTFFHIAIVYDCQTNGNVGYTAAGVLDASYRIAVADSPRYTMMKHFQQPIDLDAYIGVFRYRTRYMEWYRPVHIPVTFNGGATAPLDNNVLAILGQYSVMGATPGHFVGSSRIRFVDA